MPDLFEGRGQLLLYHFMFGPNQDLGCNGCSMFVDQIGHLAHLHARDTSFALVSRAPITKIERTETDGLDDSVVLVVRERLQRRLRRRPGEAAGDVYQDGETFGLSVFLRDGDSLFRTYFTTSRGVEALGSVWTFLDLTPLGRQENWEDSLAGSPQTKPYEWWRRHDEYEAPSRVQKTASGFSGEPVPPVMRRGAATKRNSTSCRSQTASRSSSCR